MSRTEAMRRLHFRRDFWQLTISRYMVCEGDGLLWRPVCCGFCPASYEVWDVETVIVAFHCDGSAWCCACGDDGSFVAGDLGGRVYFLALEETEGRT